MGSRRSSPGIPVNGILLLDKPSGLSSNAALQIVKRIFNAKKAGHTGSLDPIATGLLSLCFGRATRIAEIFLNFDKSYLVTIRLGVSTDSGDREGNIIDRSPLTATVQDIEAELENFRGTVLQVPPMFSALKKNGVPLYVLARKGLEVERLAREVTVHKLDILEFRDDLLTLSVVCSKGYYIRSLAMDLGRALGCGAHVMELRRTSVGIFKVEDAVTIEQLEAVETSELREQLLIPADQALSHLPKIEICEDQVKSVCNGQSIITATSIWHGIVRLYSPSSRFLGLGEYVSNKKIKPKRIFV